MAISRSKITVTILFFLAFFLAVNFGFGVNTAKAVDNLKNAFNAPLKNAAAGAGYNETATTEGVASLIISTILSFLGVIFLVLAIYGGYIWMIARGNEQEVEKAKSIVQNSVIGLIIVVGAYAISWYVINVLGGVALNP